MNMHQLLVLLRESTHDGIGLPRVVRGMVHFFRQERTHADAHFERGLPWFGGLCDFWRCFMVF